MSENFYISHNKDKRQEVRKPLNANNSHVADDMSGEECLATKISLCNVFMFSRNAKED